MNVSPDSLLPLERPLSEAIALYLKRLAIILSVAAINVLVFGLSLLASRDPFPILIIVAIAGFLLILIRQIPHLYRTRDAYHRLEIPAKLETKLSALRVPLDIEGSIALSWGHVPADLDLFLILEFAQQRIPIFFGNRGERGTAPWAQLDRDVRTGVGPETIMFSRLVPGKYRCYVMNFSGEAPLRESSARIELRLGPIRRVFSCPREGEGRWWDVFIFDSRSGELQEVGTISDREPMRLLR